MTELKPYKGDYYLWRYIPSLPAAIVFIALFGIITALHSWRMFRRRLWFYIPFVIGGVFEAVGYVGRAKANSGTDVLMPYVIQSFFLLVAPALLAATIYMTLGRLITSVNGAEYSIIRPRWLTRLFVIGDLASFMVQGGGAGMMTSGNNQKLGEHIVVGGLWVQIIMFGLFMITSAIFHVRFMKKSPMVAVCGPAWTRMMYTLYAVSLMIMVRSVFRVIEYTLGHDGYPLNHEWTLYVFDSVLMWLSMVIYFLFGPKDHEIVAKGIQSQETCLEMGSQDDSAASQQGGGYDPGEHHTRRHSRRYSRSDSRRHSRQHH